MAAPFVIFDTIGGSSYLTILKQMAVAERRHLDLKKYQIQVMRAGGSILVVWGEQGKLQGEGQVMAVRTDNGMELSEGEVKALMANLDRAEPVASIRGGSFLAIRAAMEVFGKQNRDLTLYSIKVAGDGETITVIFADKDRVEGTRGNTPNRPGFEVVLDPEDLHVVKSYFIR